MKQIKVLLVSCNDALTKDIQEYLNKIVENATVETVSTMTTAVDRIMSNGFDLTVIDTSMRGDSNRVAMADLIKINHAASKHLILLSDTPIERWLETVFHKPIDEINHVFATEYDNIDAQLHATLKQLEENGKVEPIDTFNSIHEDIKKSKQHFVRKHSFLMII